MAIAEVKKVKGIYDVFLASYLRSILLKYYYDQQKRRRRYLRLMRRILKLQMYLVPLEVRAGSKIGGKYDDRQTSN